MKKAICNKCNALISVDPSTPMLNCPHCKAQIFTESVIKNYMQTLSTYRRKADVAFTGKGDYQSAYDNYKLYHSLMREDLAALVSVAISCVRRSTVHQITIKEATDYLLKGSDEVEITYDNVNLLSDSLVKIRKDARLIVETFNEIKDQSKYALSMYQKAIEEYRYYLTKYLLIYESMTTFNKYFNETPKILKDEIEWCNRLLKEKINVKDKSDAKHDFYNQKHEKVLEIFPNKKRYYQTHILLYIVTGLGAVLSIIGFVFLSTKMNNIATIILLCLGLLSFFGGYFVNHHLTSKFQGK